MTRTKRISRPKRLKNQPKLPPNDIFWLEVTKNKTQVDNFLKKGNNRQKTYIKMALKYRKWQVTQGVIPETWNNKQTKENNTKVKDLFSIGDVIEE